MWAGGETLRVLIDIKHPAEANFFHPLLRRLQSRSDTVLVTAHYKAEVAEVLSALAIEHVKISEALPTPLGIVAAAAARTLRMIEVAHRFRPQIMLARVGAEIGAAGRLLRIPAVSFDENEYATVQLLVSRHLAHLVCTGMGYEKSLGRKQVRFNAVPQLAYTHPAWFTRDAARLKANGFDPAEPYAVLRLGEVPAGEAAGVAGKAAVGDLQGLFRERHRRLGRGTMRAFVSHAVPSCPVRYPTFRTSSTGQPKSRCWTVPSRPYW